ncbi:unnamed protein product [Urochloa humidicola]
MGYMDPECMMAGVRVESDVYSFGVLLLLEIACGRGPAVRVRGEEHDDDEEFVHLVQWAWDSYGRGGRRRRAAARRVLWPGDGARDARRDVVRAPGPQPLSHDQAFRQAVSC